MLDFVGDGDASSNYYLSGVTGRALYDVASKTTAWPTCACYVGVLPLAGLATATAAALAPTWHRVDLSEPASGALAATYQATGETYLNSGGKTPVPGVAYYRLAVHCANRPATCSVVRTVSYAGSVLAARAGKGAGPALEAYPNPARGAIGLVLPARSGPASIDLISATGQVARRYPTGAGALPLDA